MALTSRVIVPELGPEPEAEDIFSIHLAHLFSDHTANAHGDPGTSIIYKSPNFGDVDLKIPEHPEADKDRQLFAHYLWNASVIAAEGIESASNNEQHVRNGDEIGRQPWQDLCWDPRYWDVSGTDVLELGAGTALPSIISYLSKAKSVTITDHPSSPTITTNTITTNFYSNILKRSKQGNHLDTVTEETGPKAIMLPSNVAVYGYLWGSETFSPTKEAVSSDKDITTARSIVEAGSIHQSDLQGRSDADTELTGGLCAITSFTRPRPPTPKSFTRIIVADCLWIPSKHAAICKTILTYLREEDKEDEEDEDDGEHEVAESISIATNPTSSTEQMIDETVPKRKLESTGRKKKKRKNACALVIAGHHTGRRITSDFFALATTSTARTNNSDLHNDQTDNSNDKDDELTAQVRGKLRLAEIFEVDIDGRRREWCSFSSYSDANANADDGENAVDSNDDDEDKRRQNENENEHNAKRWCVCGVLVRR